MMPFHFFMHPWDIGTTTKEIECGAKLHPMKINWMSGERTRIGWTEATE